MDFSNWENIFGLCLIILLFFGFGTAFIFWGLRLIGAVKYRGINKRKWTKITAKKGNTKYVKERPVGRRSASIVCYPETEIKYVVDGIEYKKYIRHLSGNTDRVRIYYKNKNPDHIKLKSEIKWGKRTNKPMGVFCILMGIILWVCGCIILPEII